MHQKMRPPAGSQPGTLAIRENAVTPRFGVIRYTETTIEEASPARAEDLAPYLNREGVLWVDVQGLGDEATIRAIGDLFKIHPLALEDVVHVPQRPRTQSYDAHQVYFSRMVNTAEDGTLDIEQASIFFGPGLVLTFQERYGDVFDPVRNRLRHGVGTIRRAGADYLAYAIIDVIVDHYFPAVELVSEALDALEVRVLEAATPRTLGDLNRVKRTLLELRRGIWPQRDAISSLLRGESAFVSEPVRLYLRDTHDHVVQITDVIETYREIAGGLFNTYLAVVGNRTNDVMRVLTVMATIFIPLTFLVGIYGMNFDFMPELHVWWAYPALLVIMAASAGAMLWYFGRKGWLGPPRGPEDR